MPAIVAITTMSTVEYSTIWGERGTYDSESAGSGIIMLQDEDNLYIVTNAHVAEGANTLVVQFIDGSDAEGALRGSDTTRDLAVIEVPLAEIDPETLSAIRVAPVGDSTALRVGDPAIAIGNALGYGQSITKGVISALDREVTATDSQTGISIMNHCIQTDAAINPGNSGGALLNAKGEVVGINEIKYTSTDVEGIGYAIPMATAMPVIEQIIAREVVPEERAAFLGIQGIEITQEDAQRYQMPLGIYLAQVGEGTAAEQAGLQSGDIMTAIDGNDVSTQEALSRTMSYYAAGDTAEVTYMRADNGKYIEHRTKVTFGSRND
ncbi:MAG: trypsin-like peptidase domain-containing protein [Lachnospiraceae bacterium]|nr:trypsin-like peptidase domain-containing protein [Lachnospiraceae bacterium]